MNIDIFYHICYYFYKNILKWIILNRTILIYKKVYMIFFFSTHTIYYSYFV